MLILDNFSIHYAYGYVISSFNYFYKLPLHPIRMQSMYLRQSHKYFNTIIAKNIKLDDVIIATIFSNVDKHAIAVFSSCNVISFNYIQF